MTTSEPALDSTDDDAPTSAEQVLARLRQPEPSLHLFRGFGPLVVAVVLVVVMILLAPSVAPERVVERPVADTEVDG